jgi:hypothetical protein
MCSLPIFQLAMTTQGDKPPPGAAGRLMPNVDAKIEHGELCSKPHNCELADHLCVLQSEVRALHLGITTGTMPTSRRSTTKASCAPAILCM